MTTMKKPTQEVLEKVRTHLLAIGEILAKAQKLPKAHGGVDADTPTSAKDRTDHLIGMWENLVDFEEYGIDAGESGATSVQEMRLPDIVVMMFEDAMLAFDDNEHDMNIETD